MKMYFQQRFFSFFDSYDIYAEDGSVLYTIKGQWSLSHRFVIYNSYGEEVAEVRQKILTFLPKFEFTMMGRNLGYLRRELTFLTPQYYMDCTGWVAEGNFIQWNYWIKDNADNPIATIQKELFHFTDHYSIEVYDPANALLCLMFVLSIDAEKCSN